MEHDELHIDELLDVLASMHHFSNGGHEFETMSLVDLNKMLGLQMLPLDRETHEIWTVNKLAIILIDALRHSFEGFSRSRLDEPVNSVRAAKSNFASGRAGAETVDHQGFPRRIALRTLVLSSGRCMFFWDAVSSQAYLKPPGFSRVGDTP